jgi:hypothetical protein
VLFYPKPLQKPHPPLWIGTSNMWGGSAEPGKRHDSAATIASRHGCHAPAPNNAAEQLGARRARVDDPADATRR